jgi:hypothetical protein
MRILLCFVVFCLVAARSLLAAPFDKAKCGCVLDMGRYGRAEYVRKQSILYSAINLKATFEQPNIDTRQALAILDLVIADYKRLSKTDFLQRLAQLDGKMNALFTTDSRLKKDWAEAHKNIKTGLSGRGEVQIWIIHTACTTADLLHQYYTKHPVNQSNSNDIGGSSDNNNSTTVGNQSTLIDMQMTIIIAAASGLISLILGIFIALIIVRRHRAEPEEATQAVLNSKDFGAVFRKFAASIEGQINSALKDQNERIYARLQEQQSAGSGAKAEEITALEQKIREIPVVDVGLIERLLNDFNIRIAKMEQAPKTKYEIHFSAEDFGELLKNNRQLINILRETLHINTLQATIMSLLPKPLDLKTLDEIQQDTLRHHWRLFNLNPDFLPKFKEDIMQDVQDAIQKRR